MEFRSNTLKTSIATLVLRENSVGLTLCDGLGNANLGGSGVLLLSADRSLVEIRSVCRNPIKIDGSVIPKISQCFEGSEQ